MVYKIVKMWLILHILWIFTLHRRGSNVKLTPSFILTPFYYFMNVDFTPSLFLPPSIQGLSVQGLSVCMYGFESIVFFNLNSPTPMPFLFISEAILWPQGLFVITVFRWALIIRVAKIKPICMTLELLTWTATDISSQKIKKVI